MPNQTQEFNPSIQHVIKLFNTTHAIEGKFKLMFTPANSIPDSDGQTVIDAYLKPMDDMARKSVDQAGEKDFLHLQMLSDTVSESILGYAFVVNVHSKDSCIYDLDLQDTDESRELYETLKHAIA